MTLRLLFYRNITRIQRVGNQLSRVPKEMHQRQSLVHWCRMPQTDCCVSAVIRSMTVVCLAVYRQQISLSETDSSHYMTVWRQVTWQNKTIIRRLDTQPLGDLLTTTTTHYWLLNVKKIQHSNRGTTDVPLLQEGLQFFYIFLHNWFPVMKNTLVFFSNLTGP